jgi:hypothetical protein
LHAQARACPAASAPDPVGDCERSGGKWVSTIDPSETKPQPVPLPGGEVKPFPGGEAVPPKQKRCSCAAPAGTCVKYDADCFVAVVACCGDSLAHDTLRNNPCALVKCASPNCGPNEKIVTKAGKNM